MTDLDECQDAADNECDAVDRATCTNMVGYFTCECNEGWEGTGLQDNCTDIDECERGMAICDPNADCVNTAGSYICTCVDGYDGDGRECSGKTLWMKTRSMAHNVTWVIPSMTLICLDY